jgi:hypothetical protein
LHFLNLNSYFVRKSTPVIKAKALTLLFVVFTVFSPAQAQLKVFNNSPEFKQALDKIMSDYCNQFRNLKGEALVNNPESSEFTSLVQLPGSEECSIIQMRNTRHETAAFQALMLSSEDYEAASKKYRQLYNQLHNASIRLDNGGMRYTVKGEMEKPSDEKKIISTLFEITPYTNLNKNVHIELSMAYELMEWKVRIAVYDKVDDAEVRPSAN